MPLIAGERSHGMYVGKRDLTSEAADITAKLCKRGTICQQCALQPERWFPAPTGVWESPANVWPHQEEQKCGLLGSVITEGIILVQIWIWTAALAHAFTCKLLELIVRALDVRWVQRPISPIEVWWGVLFRHVSRLISKCAQTQVAS